MAASAAFSVLALLLAFLLLELVVGRRFMSDDSTFDESYGVTWGKDHVMSLDQGRQLQLSLDQSSGFIHLLFLSLFLILFSFFFFSLFSNALVCNYEYLRWIICCGVDILPSLTYKNLIFKSNKFIYVCFCNLLELLDDMWRC